MGKVFDWFMDYLEFIIFGIGFGLIILVLIVIPLVDDYNYMGSRDIHCMKELGIKICEDNYLLFYGFDYNMLFEIRPIKIVCKKDLRSDDSIKFNILDGDCLKNGNV